MGTIFVNTISNILSTMASECSIEIEMLNDVKIKNILGGYQFLQNKTILLGDLKYGQPRDCLLELEYPEEIKQLKLPIANIKLTYYDY